MLDVVEQSARSSVLLAFGQLFDLAERLLKQLCHGGSVP